MPATVIKFNARSWLDALNLTPRQLHEMLARVGVNASRATISRWKETGGMSMQRWAEIVYAMQQHGMSAPPPEAFVTIEEEQAA